MLFSVSTENSVNVLGRGVSFLFAFDVGKLTPSYLEFPRWRNQHGAGVAFNVGFIFFELSLRFSLDNKVV